MCAKAFELGAAQHCSLARSAPVLVVIALVELGLDPLEAVEFVRKRRRGALNARQVNWVASYKARLKHKDCIIL